LIGGGEKKMELKWTQRNDEEVDSRTAQRECWKRGGRRERFLKTMVEKETGKAFDSD